jgi:hypothetical protein
MVTIWPQMSQYGHRHHDMAAIYNLCVDLYKSVAVPLFPVNFSYSRFLWLEIPCKALKKNLCNQRDRYEI